MDLSTVVMFLVGFTISVVVMGLINYFSGGSKNKESVGESKEVDKKEKVVLNKGLESKKGFKKEDKKKVDGGYEPNTNLTSTDTLLYTNVAVADEVLNDTWEEDNNKIKDDDKGLNNKDDEHKYHYETVDEVKDDSNTTVEDKVTNTSKHNYNDDNTSSYDSSSNSSYDSTSSYDSSSSSSYDSSSSSSYDSSSSSSSFD